MHTPWPPTVSIVEDCIPDEGDPRRLYSIGTRHPKSLLLSPKFHLASRGFYFGRSNSHDCDPPFIFNSARAYIFPAALGLSLSVSPRRNFSLSKPDFLGSRHCSHYPVSNVTRPHCFTMSVIWQRPTNALASAGTPTRCLHCRFSFICQRRCARARLSLTRILGIRVCGQSFRVVWQRLCRMIAARPVFTRVDPPPAHERSFSF